MDAAQPPWLAISLAVIALVGSLGAAYVPVMLEKVKISRGERAPITDAEQTHAAALVPPAPAPSGPDPFELIEAAVADYRAQRDRAIARADRLQLDLNQARAELAEALIHIARLEARGRFG